MMPKEKKSLVLVWTNGKQYEIDRVTDVRQALSLKGGGLGMRYTVRVRGKEVYLFEDEGKMVCRGMKSCSVSTW